MTVGGGDSITTGRGIDVVLGGEGADVIHAGVFAAGEGSNVVFGDHGFVDWVTQDADPTDVDRIWSTDHDTGGADTITTGDASDIVIGGGFGDTVVAGHGDNIVFGDNGKITAAVSDLGRWTGLPATLAISLGVVETVAPERGGSDGILTGVGNDLVLGGAGGDGIDSAYSNGSTTADGKDIVIGDHAKLVYGNGVSTVTATGSELRDGVLVTLTPIDTMFGGSDVVYTGAGEDLVVGGTGSDALDAGSARDLVFGDNAL